MVPQEGQTELGTYLRYSALAPCLLLLWLARARAEANIPAQSPQENAKARLAPAGALGNWRSNTEAAKERAPKALSHTGSVAINQTTPLDRTKKSQAKRGQGPWRPSRHSPESLKTPKARHGYPSDCAREKLVSWDCGGRGALSSACVLT